MAYECAKEALDLGQQRPLTIHSFTLARAKVQRVTMASWQAQILDSSGKIMTLLLKYACRLNVVKQGSVPLS